MTGILIRRGGTQRDLHREESHVNMEACESHVNIRVMFPQVEECLGPPEPERGKGDRSSPEASEGAWPADTLTTEL